MLLVHFMDVDWLNHLTNKKYPNLKIIALSMNGDEVYYYKMIIL